MNLLAQNVIEISGRARDDFKIGYHASPSMQRLHLHVVSNDFESPSLKTKIHWNSFNTELFLSTDCMYLPVAVTISLMEYQLELHLLMFCCIS